MHFRLLHKFLKFFLLVWLAGFPCLLWAQDARFSGYDSGPPAQWYRSNKSGLALERMFSRLAALREEYALRVRSVSLRDTPELLYPHYNVSYTIEERVLFEKGIEIRRQWLFRDQRGTARLNASFSPGFFSSQIEVFIDEDEEYEEDDEEDSRPEEKAKTGFIEIFNEWQYLTEERVFSQDGSESFVRFFYNEGILIRTESWKRFVDIPEEEDSDEESLFAETVSLNEETHDELILQFVDYYRYTRANYLRAVERVYHAAVEEDKNRLRLSFPSLGPGVVPAIDFEFPHIPISFGADDGFEVPQGERVTYTTDNRGRALREIRRDGDENILGEVENFWEGDRLASVRISAGEEERIIEFEYDQEGNRIMERNFRNGILERTVRSDGDRDTEELYLDGVVILRAVWEGGRKISEERVRPSNGASR